MFPVHVQVNVALWSQKDPCKVALERHRAKLSPRLCNEIQDESVPQQQLLQPDLWICYPHKECPTEIEK